jgi:hypothetical protein
MARPGLFLITSSPRPVGHTPLYSPPCPVSIAATSYSTGVRPLQEPPQRSQHRCWSPFHAARLPRAVGRGGRGLGPRMLRFCAPSTRIAVVDLVLVCCCIGKFVVTKFDCRRPSRTSTTSLFTRSLVKLALKNMKVEEFALLSSWIKGAEY